MNKKSVSGLRSSQLQLGISITSWIFLIRFYGNEEGRLAFFYSVCLEDDTVIWYCECFIVIIIGGWKIQYFTAAKQRKHFYLLNVFPNCFPGDGFLEVFVTLRKMCGNLGHNYSYIRSRPSFFIRIWVKMVSYFNRRPTYL